MQHDRQTQSDHPLRHLTAAQFMALGGDAVVYVKQVKGDSLGSILPDGDFAANADFHRVVSADGSPLMIGDSQEAVVEWLQAMALGVVTLH